MIQTDQGTWNQYDGCIYATKGGMFFNVKEKITGGFQQVMLQDGKSILKKYLESAITLPEDNAELVKMMGTVTDIVSGGIKDHFLKNRHNPDAILFKKVMLASTKPFYSIKLYKQSFRKS